MRCRDVQRLATEYVDGDLDSTRSSAVRGHLRTCDDCNEQIQDEGVIARAGADLDALMDPPATLWNRIGEELAQHELADSKRSRTWLWWQSLRPHVPQVGAGLCVAVIAVVWLSVRDRSQVAEPTVRVERAELAAEQGGAPPTVPHEEHVLTEVRAANDRYLATIEEIRSLVEESRTEWPRERGRAFDERLAEFARVTRPYQKKLALADATDIADPTDHDALFALYRAEIDFLHRAEFPEFGERGR